MRSKRGRRGLRGGGRRPRKRPKKRRKRGRRDLRGRLRRGGIGEGIEEEKAYEERKRRNKRKREPGLGIPHSGAGGAAVGSGHADKLQVSLPKYEI